MTTTGFVVSCYNQAQYISRCIESVLDQTRQPDRIVVVDDGSSDGSQDVVRTFSARGVELLETDRLGPSGAFNTGISAIETDIVAILGGDDQALPDRLSQQVQLLVRFGVDLVMGLPLVIDENDAARSDDLCPEFFVHFRSGTGHLLRQLFNVGNFLCAPTATFTRETYLELGGFRPGLLQLQDFDLWVRWAGRRSLVLVDQRFIRYRRTPNNLSSRANDRRMNAERLWVYRRFFDNVADPDIEDAFHSDLHQMGRSGPFDRSLDVAMLYLGHPDPLIYQIGCEYVLDLCEDETGTARLAESGIRIQDVYELTGRGDISRDVARDSLLDDLGHLRRGMQD